ncbi:amidohydrolase [Acetobacter estunensis NRIC 0472]|uniref:Amidohydrolase family protein n=1 Tax=Acetobacter estunensis TaxID=104097 RepID=A0A967B9B2_9PROT|nr:amidohydrolase family protein [Acetobacter estunensis]NHO54709.1 amidohydrolase family protein [Acetobacter estunensis]GBQ21321.1 amidohydrolase [Acetobacter estunensis NRIC 0472]
MRPNTKTALLIGGILTATTSLATTHAKAEPIALTHIRVIDGTGAPPVEDATLVMEKGRILAIGPNVQPPANAKILDRHGDTVLPGLISDHSHVGQVDGATTGPQNYNDVIIKGELGQFRRYGVLTVTALGNNRPEIFDPLRRLAHAGQLPADLFGVDQGIGVPKGAPPVNVAKDQLFRPASVEEARKDVDKMAREGTDLVKIWVDDFDGTLPVKMSPAIIAAVVDQSHKHNLRVAAHIHDLADAELVVASGVDILAHGVRDQPVPPDFVQALKNKGIWYIATLQLDEATTAWADRAPWTLTSFARLGVSKGLAAEIDNPAWQAANRVGRKADEARASLAMNLRNLKTLHDAGVKIGFGTDSGAMPLRVPGVAEHRELDLTVQAGLTPLEAIHLATGNAAALLNRSDRGVLAPGKRADLLVVEGDPAENIAEIDNVVETWSHDMEAEGLAEFLHPKEEEKE